MLTAADRVHLSIQAVLSLLAVVGNVVLLVVIWKRTTANMRAYSIFLINCAVVDIILAIFGIFTCTQVVSGPENATILVYIGPCSLVNEDLCHQTHVTLTSLTNQSTLLILLSFCYRLHILEKVAVKSADGWVIWFACTAPLLLSVVNVIAYCDVLENGDPQTLRDLHLENCVCKVFPKPKTVQAAIVISANTLISPLLMGVIFGIRRRLIRRIRESASFSQKELVLHQRIAKTLTYQSLLPFGYLLSVIVWAIDQNLHFNSELAQRMMIMVMTFNCLASPVINILYLPPYRRIFIATTSVEKIQSLT